MLSSLSYIVYQVVHGKRLFASIKGHLCLTKRYLDNPEWQVEFEFCLIRNVFWHFWFKIRKSFFSKTVLLNQQQQHFSSIVVLHTVLPTLFLFTQCCWLFFNSILTFNWNFSAALWFWLKWTNFAELIYGVYITPRISKIFSQGPKYMYWNRYSP